MVARQAADLVYTLVVKAEGGAVHPQATSAPPLYCSKSHKDCPLQFTFTHNPLIQQ